MPDTKKGVLKGNGNVYDRQIPVKLNSGKIIYVQSLNGKYVNPDTIYNPGDSVNVDQSTFENKANVFRSMKKQFGGNNAVIIEDGELYKDNSGHLRKSNSFNHEDEILLDKYGNEIVVPKGNGGEIVNAQSVLSDSYEKVKDGTRDLTQKEKVVKFKPKESNELFQDILPNFKTKKNLSPSELVKTAIKFKESFKSKFEKEYANDKYSQKAKKLNLQQTPYIPTDEDLFEIVHNQQENKKDKSGLDFGDKAQYGNIPVNLNGLYEEDSPVIVPSNDITMEGINENVLAYDADTLEYLTEMEPNMNYDFKNKGVSNVLEIPKAQQGRADHYRQLLREAQEKYKRYDDQYQNAKTPSAKKLAELNRQEAYNSVEYLSGRTQPEPTYSGTPWNPLSNVQVNVPPPTNAIPFNPLNDIVPIESAPITQYSGSTVPTTQSIVPQSSARINGRQPWDYGNYRQDNLKDNVYTVGKGDWLSSIAASNGTTVDDILAYNPQIGNRDMLEIGDEIFIPTKDPRAVPQDIPLLKPRQNSLTDYINTDLEAPTEIEGLDEYSRPNLKPVAGIASNALDQVLGSYNTKLPTNALRQMILNNIGVNLPYRPEVPNRTYNYNEIDALPNINRIASSVNSQLQNVNSNTSQGQAVAAAIGARRLDAENDVMARTAQQNQQIRTQVDNMNVQSLNQMDLMQQQFNKNYVDEVQQTLAVRDSARLAQADYLDQLELERLRVNNTITNNNITNRNFQIDPVTGKVTRKKVTFGNTVPINNAKFGFKKKY